MKAGCKLHLELSAQEKVFGPGPAELLRGIERLGSLRAAASCMDMAYSKAIRLLQHAEKGFGQPLTRRQVGGSQGGGSELTEFAKDLLARYERLVELQESDAQARFETLFAGFGGHAKLACIVMANGKSSRFGDARSKLLQVLPHGKTVFEQTVSRVPRELFDLVCVSSHAEIKELAARLGIVCVEPASQDLSDTIRAGLSVSEGATSCLFLPADQLLVKEESLRALVAAQAEFPRHVIRLSWKGCAKSPVLFPSRYYPRLKALKGDVGGAVLLRPGAELAEFCHCVEASSEEELFDIDTRADFERCAELLSASELQSAPRNLSASERL